MPSNSGSFSGDGGAFKGDDLAEQAAQANERVKDRVSSIARTASDTVDSHRATTAAGLEAAASTLHDRAERLPGGDKLSDVAHAAADRLSTTADYVRTHDVNRMKTDVKTLVKNNPGPSLLVAAAVGFLLGRAITRD